MKIVQIAKPITANLAGVVTTFAIDSTLHSAINTYAPNFLAYSASMTPKEKRIWVAKRLGVSIVVAVAAGIVAGVVQQKVESLWTETTVETI